MRLKKNTMARVKKILAYEIIDSRGYPTIEGKLILDDDQAVTTAIPSGVSIGKYEAYELRDGDPNRFDGMGVSKAVYYINELIAPKLIGVSPFKQQEVDSWLIKADGTKNKKKLGANTTLTISQLFVKAAAACLRIPIFRYINKLYFDYFKSQIKIKKIPTPIFNIISGGKHANNNLEFQEFQIIPSSANSFSKSYQLAIEIFHELKNQLNYHNVNISIGEEGGYTPTFSANIDALEIIKEAIYKKNLNLGFDIFFGLDIAASHFYKEGKYQIRDRQQLLGVDQYLEFIVNLTKKYPFLVLEDPLSDEDWENWKKLNQLLSQQTYLVGDDLLTTNKEKLIKAIKERACTSIVIKPNQIGTISETLEVINIAQKNNFNYIVSHRLAETTDSFIADFAVAVQADFVKFGAPCRGERVAKYNRLWQIEKEELNLK